MSDFAYPPSRHDDWRRDPIRPEDGAAETGTGDRALPLREVLTWDRNSWRHLVFLVATALAVAATGPWGLLLYPALHLVTDLLYYVARVAWFDPAVTVQRGYQASAVFHDALHSQGLDYGFNFYDGDFTKDRKQAQVDKFEHAWAQLCLEPGMRLLDVGCGCGDWLAWVRSRGVEVMGINITREQVLVCRSRGLEVLRGDWRVIAADEAQMAHLTGRFDAVTFWDTVEHYVPMQYRGSDSHRDAIYQAMFGFAHRVIQHGKRPARVFISCLHMRHTLSESRTLRDTLRTAAFGWLLDKFHSGCYPNASRDCLVKNADHWFELVERTDTTRDYYMTSVLEPHHFGRSRFGLTPTRAVYALWLVLADPFWAHRALWFLTEDWMAQFDPQDLERSAVVHWWLTFDARPAAASSGSVQ